MRLIIAEKPSVSRAIVEALTPSLGPFAARGGYFETRDGSTIVSNAIGHLCEIFSPLAEVKGAALPILPPNFEIRPIERTIDQYKLLKTLIAKADTVTNAADAGREGQLIFDLIFECAVGKGKAPKTDRMWLQSMTIPSILSAWENRKPYAQYKGLSDAARSRTEADWLLGINGTRALSRAMGTSANAGRVQSPTLNLIVQRYEQINKFVPKDFYEIHGTFSIDVTSKYIGKWQNPNPAPETPVDRTMDRTQAEAVAAKCSGQAVQSVVDTTKPKSQLPPKLFDLTTLQREANAAVQCGFSAQETLTITQQLYERHKAVTYPRTDSQNLPDDYVDEAEKTIHSLARSGHPAAVHALNVANSHWVKPVKRVFDSNKVSDHFAIIPTTQTPTGLSPQEQVIYDMIVKRFIAVFFPNAELQVTERITTVSSERFKSNGRVMLDPGWKAVYAGDPVSKDGDEDDEEPDLCAYKPGQIVKTLSVLVKGLKTSPPRLFTEATLLAAMESAGRFVEDGEAAEAMKERGLGTPATRAATIEGLLAVKQTREAYIVRQRKNLVPTKAGIALIEFLNSKGIQSLLSPATTGEWEMRLRQMEKPQGGYSRDRFMQEISDETSKIVGIVGAGARASGGSVAAGDGPRTFTPRGDLLKCKCPRCRTGDVLLNDRTASCGCGLTVWRSVCAKNLSVAQMTALIGKGRTARIEGFTSKAGKPFGTGLVLDVATGRATFDFDAK